MSAIKAVKMLFFIMFLLAKQSYRLNLNRLYYGRNAGFRLFCGENESMNYMYKIYSIFFYCKKTDVIVQYKKQVSI